MAKERMINTRIWSDNWVSELDPIEKLLFLYFLTNSYTNISGIYEVPLKVAAVETGIDPSMLAKILPRLEPKVIHRDGWVIMPNFTKYQNTNNPKIVEGIRRELDNVPEKVRGEAIGYGYPMDRLSHLTKLNLTKPTDTANAGTTDVPVDSYFRGDSGESKSPRVSGDKRKAYDELIAWSANERGFPFPKTTTGKQYRAFKLANENGFKREQLIERWEEMASDKFWQKVGFDWMNVVQELLKKPV